MTAKRSMSATDSEAAPGLVPAGVSINYTIWEAHCERLERLEAECPHVRLGGKNAKDSPRAGEHKSRDAWGCLWHFPGQYLDGVVVEHPLADWEAMDAWTPPSPDERVARAQADAKAARQEDRRLSVGMEHGFLFLRLTYLRGFENFMVDVAEDHPKLYELRDIVTEYWLAIVRAYLEAGATHVGGGDDLGLQDRLPISPPAWRKLLKPAFTRIFSLAREYEASVYLHTDGCIVDIIPDLIEAGVSCLNPQDLVNGLDNLARLAKGKIDINLDIDRQKITVFGTPEEIDAHIKTCIQTLGSPQGGLSLTYGVYPGTPVENLEAAVRAMERYRTLWV